MVNKHTVIVVASIVVIIGVLGYSSTSLVFAKDLQFRWHQEGSFDLLSILFGGNIFVCNNSDYPISFAKYSFNIIYDGQDLGTFSVDGATLAPHSGAMINGRFESDDQRVSQILFSSLDTALSGSGMAARINVDLMSVTTVLDTKIIGIIPVSTAQEYSGHEFLEFMNQKTECDK